MGKKKKKKQRSYEERLERLIFITALFQMLDTILDFILKFIG